MNFSRVCYLFLIGLFSGVFASCQSNSKTASNPLLDSLKLKKQEIDSQLSPKTLEIWVKQEGRKGLSLVVNNRFPAKIEASYNVFKDKDGDIRYFAEFPTSPDREWFIAYRSYLDKKGNVFAFQRLNNFFHSECTKGAAIENLTRYYAADFKLVDSVYSLTNSKKDTLDRKTCKFPYNFKYEVFGSLNELKKAKGITEF